MNMFMLWFRFSAIWLNDSRLSRIIYKWNYPIQLKVTWHFVKKLDLHQTSERRAILVICRSKIHGLIAKLFTMSQHMWQSINDVQADKRFSEVYLKTHFKKFIKRVVSLNILIQYIQLKTRSDTIFGFEEVPNKSFALLEKLLIRTPQVPLYIQYQTLVV